MLQSLQIFVIMSLTHGNFCISSISKSRQWPTQGVLMILRNYAIQHGCTSWCIICDLDHIFGSNLYGPGNKVFEIKGLRSRWSYAETEPTIWKIATTNVCGSGMSCLILLVGRIREQLLRFETGIRLRSIPEISRISGFKWNPRNLSKGSISSNPEISSTQLTHWTHQI
mgnify:CR=1 FL=1